MPLKENNTLNFLTILAPGAAGAGPANLPSS